MTPKSFSVLLDTSFFIRLLDKSDPLHAKAIGYYKYFMDRDIIMTLSTISIAEFCVRGDIQDLPLRNLQILPFNIVHAKRAGEFAGIVFGLKGQLQLTQRTIIPNDTKLFAQADAEVSVRFYLSSDSESQKIFNLLGNHSSPKFQFINMNMPHHEAFGELDLG